MKKIGIFLTALAAVFFCSCAQVEPDVWGGITGVVKDARTNQPLEGVKVTVTSTGDSKITGSDGQFSFDNLDEREYTLSFEKSGYFTATQVVRVLAGETVSAHIQLRQNMLGIDVSPASLDFGTDKSSLNLTVNATGGDAVHFEVSVSDSWLNVDPRSATVTTTTTLRVLVNRNNLAAGRYEGMINVTANNSTLTVPVYMQVAGAAEPVVSIQSVNEITQTTARVYGLLTLEGGISVSDYGICYAATALPTINNSKVSRGGSSSSQSFDCLLSGLAEGSEYHARAYAVSNGRTYYSADKTFTTASGSGGGQGSEDYSSAIVSSDNRKVTVNLVSCYRNGNRVKIEATIRNSGVTTSNNYYIYQNNYGYTVGGYTYNTYVEDDIYTTYNNYAVTVDLNNKSGNSGVYTQLPLNSTKKMTVYVDGVPKDARTVSVYLATEFRDSDPREYAYLTFGNVPIY